MALGNIQCADILSYLVPIIGAYHGWIQRKNFQNKVSKKAGNVIFQIQYFTRESFY